MSTSVLINPPKPKGDISHLVGRPLVPFFEDGSSKYDNFSVPAEYQIAARKFVNGYWVNEDGSRAEIGENTPTLIKKNDSLENSSNKKQQNKNQSKPSKNNNNNANKENINHKSNKSSSQLLSPTTNSQQTKAEKKKSKAANNSSPTPSSPSYAAIVARTSSAPSSTTTNETFQTPSRSKSTANPSNTAAISTSKDNYAALASPAPVNIPMPKFLGSSPAPTTASNTTPTSTDAQSCEEMSAHLMSLLKKTTISSNPSNPSVSVSSVASGASVPSGVAMPYPYPYPHHPYPYPYSASGHAVYSAPAIPQQPAQNSSSAPSQSSTSAGALMLLTGNQSGESSVRTVHVNTPANTHAAPLPPPAFAAPYPFPNYSYHHYPAAAYPSYSHTGYAPVGYGAYHHPHYMAVPPPAAAVTH